MTESPATDFDPAYRDRETYFFWTGEHVRFTDLDALGHVSAVRTNEYFNSARASLFQQTIANWPQAEQLPVLKLSIVLNEREMHFPLDIDVGLAIEKWGNTSVTVVLAAFDGVECLALSRNVFVFIDADTREPARPHEDIRAAITRLAGEVVVSPQEARPFRRSIN
jgi:acyl-CoA thioester hydrolase